MKTETRTIVTTKKGDVPLILFSGMGADARVFAEQKKAIPHLSVPTWLVPMPNESLAGYAARWAPLINPGQPCFIGGASFGGFVAMEMIRHLDVMACFLIGSVRSPAQFPKRFHALRKIPAIADALPFELVTLLSKAALLSSGSTITNTHLHDVLEQMTESDASFLRWACQAVLRWKPPALTHSVPIHHIHGQNDCVLPVANTTPDEVVAGAGHALSMSHPAAVNAFLKAKMEHHMARLSEPIRKTARLPFDGTQGKQSTATTSGAIR